MTLEEQIEDLQLCIANGGDGDCNSLVIELQRLMELRDTKRDE